MKKFYSQRELLDEGFWSKFKTGAANVAKGALEVGKFAAEKLTPKAHAYVSGMVDSTKRLDQNVRRATTSPEDYLKQMYEDQGYINVSVTPSPSKGSKKWFTVKLSITDPDTGQVQSLKPKIVDEEGYENVMRRQLKP